MPHAPQAPKIETGKIPINTTNKYYLEFIAKAYNFFSEKNPTPDITEPKFRPMEAPPHAAELYKCTVGFKVGHTKSGVFFKSLVCGREYCLHCSKDYSIAHCRRIVRVFPKVMQFKKAGYFVFTVPAELREKFKSKTALNNFRNFIRRKLKRGQLVKTPCSNGTYKKTFYKIEKAFLRWHWCGEDGTTWKPHLNVIIEAGHIEQWYLKKLKHDVRRYFEREFNLQYTPKINLFYAYCKPKTLNGQYKLKHWINYITRATAKHLTDADSIDTIHKYRNISYLGKFEKPTIEATNRAASIIANGIDNETGEVITWSKDLLKPAVFFKEYHPFTTDLGAGIFFLLKHPPE